MNNISYKKIFYLLILQTVFIHFNCKLISETVTQTLYQNAAILGIDIAEFLIFTKLTIEEESQENITKIENYKVEFLEERKNNKPIKPFASFSELPDKIKNIEIKNPTMALKADKKFYLSGDINILGFESTAEIAIRSHNQASLKIKAPTNWVKENLLKLEVSNQLNLSDAYIIISSYPYMNRNKKPNIEIKKGFNIISEIEIQKNTILDNLLGKTNDKLFLSGTFGTNLSNISLAIAIPVDIKLSDNISLKNISLVISGIGEIKIKSQIKLKKPNLLFTGAFGINPLTSSIEGSGTMQGIWENPLGLRGISISNTAIESAISIVPPAPIPTKIGITGELNIGNVQGMAAIKIDSTGQGGIIAYINKLTLKDLLTIPAKLTPAVDWNKLQNKIPEIIIKNIDIKAAVVPFQIGEISFEPGINLKGEINILNKFEALVDCSVGSNGIIAKGTASEISIGKILKITGAGFDGVYGNEDDGPTIDFEITKQNQHLIISGMGKLMGIQGKTEVNIGRKEINFITMYDIIGSGMTIEGKSSGNIDNIESLDFEIYGQFKNELTEYIADQIREKLGSVAGSIANFYGTAVMPLKISKIQVWTTFKEIRQGKLPRARIDITALGKKFTIDEQLDLKKPQEMIWHLIKSILNGMQDFITDLPEEIAKKFIESKDKILNSFSEFIAILKNGNVVFHNDTKYKIKLKIKYKKTLKSYDDIIIEPNSSLNKWLRKNLRNMELYIKKDGKWKLANSWIGESNNVRTYLNEIIQINFGYFPNEQKFKRRIKKGNEE